MEKFIISSDDCLILKAFNETQSLREAALLLKCDPAGLTRRVQNISNEYGLIQKVNNRWQLTGEGKALVAWTESSIQSQKKTLSGKNTIRIASTMWFAEQVLIPKFSKLKKAFDQNISFSFSVPNKNFESVLIEGSADFVIACHPPESPEIEHKKVCEEKWMIIVPASWKLKSNIPITELRNRPFIRNSEMNTYLFIPELAHFEQESEIIFDNLIGIRTALKEGLGWSIVPKLLVQEYFNKEELTEISYDLVMNDRKVCLWWMRNSQGSRKISPKLNHWLKESCS
jgi:DNA-binding transcriptional LysR family regulator